MALQPDNGEFNASQCICSDLQHEDYSPLYAWFNYIVIIIMLPSLSAFGVVTNLVNVFVYSRPRMRNSSNTYLLFLACSDFFVVLTGLFIFWIDSARSYIPQLVQAPYTTVHTLPFGYMAQSCSIYFTVAAAFDCYVCVCWRRKSKQHCTVSRARRIVGAIVLLSVLYNSLRFPQFNLRKCIHEGSGEMIVEICPTSLFFRINTIYNVYLYMVVMTLFPFMVLLLLNLLIICRKSFDAKRHHKQKKKSTSSSIASSIPATIPTANGSLGGSLRSGNQKQQANGQANNNNNNNSANNKPHIAAALLGGPMAKFPALPKAVSPGSDETITMIMVVVLFLCCNTLALIVNLIETFFEPDALLLNLLSDASNFLVIFNSSVNCVIYLIFNNEYRDVFLAHFVHFKGRCYPFHLLQYFFEGNGRSGRSANDRTIMKCGGIVAAPNGTIAGYSAPSGAYSAEKPSNAGKLLHMRKGESVTEANQGSGPGSPVWLQQHHQCPCLASTANSAHSPSSARHHFCHHHPCPCWPSANKYGHFEWGTFLSDQRAARLASEEFEDWDSGCDEENCSNTQQRLSLLGGGGTSSSACPSPMCRRPRQQRGPPPLNNSNCYLAEVKMILENERTMATVHSPPPHIYVRPLLRGNAGGFGALTGGCQGGSGFAAEPIEFMDEAVAAIFLDPSESGGNDNYPVTAL